MKNNKLNIKFGTDGWRGVIADTFTFENVYRVAQAISEYAVKKINSPEIVVGYDTRFLSRQFAETIANTISENGCSVILSDTYLSTPALSLNVLHHKAFGGIVVSASHNPPEFNGIKFKTSKGCSASEDVTKYFEKETVKKRTKAKKGKIVRKDLLGIYLNKLRSFVDFNIINRANTKIISDPMYGAGINYLTELLKSAKCDVTQIHGTLDPLFNNIHPEPIEKNLSDLKKAVIQNNADIGLAVDGDADRIGVVDERGRYLTPHQVFPLLLYYLCHYKKLRGKVVQTISLGYLSERIAKDYKLDWTETKVGFKYIADYIMNDKVLIGGEESGGYGYGNYIPERDGILNALMIVEMLKFTGKKLSELVDEIENKYGASRFLRTDFINPGIQKEKFVKALKQNAPDKIGGLKIKKIKDYDGIEFVLEDDSWLLLRPSGTEPVIRVYSESNEINKTKNIIQSGNKMVSSLIDRKKSF